MLYVNLLRFIWFIRRYRQAIAQDRRTVKFDAKAKKEATIVLYINPETAAQGLDIHKGRFVDGAMQNATVVAGGQM